jgi:hypothetical protein
VSPIHIDDLVFLDEAGLTLSMGLRYGWAPRGKRLVGRVPFKGGARSATILAAMSTGGMLTELVVEGYANKEIFRILVKDWLAAEPGQVVVMDNLDIHKDPEVIAAIEAVGARVVFLPPYSPELNPIEEG